VYTCRTTVARPRGRAPNLNDGVYYWGLRVSLTKDSRDRWVYTIYCSEIQIKSHKKCHFAWISYQPSGLSSFFGCVFDGFFKSNVLNDLWSTYKCTHWPINIPQLIISSIRSRDMPKSTIKYQSHTYTINEITCKLIQFLSSIYITFDNDILIEIYLKLVVQVSSSS